MSRQAPAKRALSYVHALCHAGLPAEVLVPALLDALHGVIPSERNLFDWTDDQGNLVRYFIEGPVDTHIARLYFERFHNAEEAACMPSFISLRHAPAGVRSARALATPAFFSSALYHEIWKPQGMHTRLEGVVRSRSGRLLGSLVLYRGPRDPVFGVDDEHRLQALLPQLAHALEQAPVSAHDDRFVPSPEPPCTLLLDAQGRIVSASAHSARLLLLADGGLSPQTVFEPLNVIVSRRFGRLLDTLRQRLPLTVATALQPAPSLTLVNACGRFVAHADWLWAGDGAASPACVQLRVQHLEPQRVAVHRILRRLPLTPGQAAVCASLHAGHAQADIAGRLGVAPSTVVDHVRKAYRRLGVADAAALRVMIERELARPA